MTITGTGVAVFAVLGLNTSVFISSKDAGDAGVAFSASSHVAGELVSLCDTDPEGLRDIAARDCVMDSKEVMVEVV